MRVARETWLLGLICLLDLAYTVWLLAHGTAIEGNPILAFYLERGIPAFVGAKLLFFVVGPLIGIEWVRRRHPVYVQRMLRLGLVLYVAVYLFGVWRVNTLAAQPAPAADASLAAIAR